MPIRHLHNAVKFMEAVSPPHTQKFSGIRINTAFGRGKTWQKAPKILSQLARVAYAPAILVMGL